MSNKALRDDQMPLRQILDIVGNKWTPVVLYALSKTTLRYSDLQRKIPDISKKMLTQVLRRLERDGLVNRKVYPVVPPKTEYKLTPLGRKIHEPIATLCRWAQSHQDVLAKIGDKKM